MPEIAKNHQSFGLKILEKCLNLWCLKLVPFPNEILNNGSLWRGVAVNDIEGKNKKLCQSIRSMYAPQITQALNNNW